MGSAANSCRDEADRGDHRDRVQRVPGRPVIESAEKFVQLLGLGRGLVLYTGRDLVERPAGEEPRLDERLQALRKGLRGDAEPGLKFIESDGAAVGFLEHVQDLKHVRPAQHRE